MKTFLVIALLTFYSVLSFAQLQTEHYPNGNKKSEGMVIMQQGAKPALKTDTKKAQREKERNTIRDGKWTFWFENGQLSAEEFYVKGTPTGTWTTYHYNGKLSSSINFETGKAVYYHDGGQKFEEGNITDSFQREGKWTGWNENGKLNYEGTYTNGVKTGTWKWYDMKGKLVKEEQVHVKANK